MILAISYSIKGVKKGHKKYKQRQAEKEQKLLEERGQLPDLQDPSRELDTTCQAVLNRQTSSQAISTRSRKSSLSTLSAEKALRDDPDFREYMEKHKSLYLQQQREAGQPPSYKAVMQEHLSPTPSMYSPPSAASASPMHCSCHECISRSQRVGSQPSGHHSNFQQHTISTFPGHETTRSVTPRPATLSLTELGDTQTTRTPIPSMVELDDTSMPFELPGNLPAILPPSKREAPVELPAQPS